MMYKHPKIILKNYLPNIMKNIIFKLQKTCWGSLRKSRLVSKIPFKKSKKFYKRNILRKHPQIAKKCIQSLKNWFFLSLISTEGIKAKLTE